MHRGRDDQFVFCRRGQQTIAIAATGDKGESEMNAKQTNYFKIGLAIVLAIVFVGALTNSVLSIRRASTPIPSPPRHVAKAQPLPASSASAASHPAAPSRTVIAPPAPPVTKEIQPTPPAETGKSAWPKFTLEEIIAYDTFAIGKSTDPAAPSNSTTSTSGTASGSARAGTGEAKAASAESDSVFAGRIHAVYQRGGRNAALVGSKTIQPGDQLDGAGRVVEVDQGGLMLEVKK